MTSRFLSTVSSLINRPITVLHTHTDGGNHNHGLAVGAFMTFTTQDITMTSLLKKKKKKKESRGHDGSNSLDEEQIRRSVEKCNQWQ